MYTNKGNTLQVLNQKHRDNHRCTGYDSWHLGSVPEGLLPCMTAISVIDANKQKR